MGQLVAVTEKRTKEELDRFVETVKIFATEITEDSEKPALSLT